MKRGLIFSLCILGSSLALAADKDTTKSAQATKSTKATKTSINLPSDVKLVATSEATEVRSFPELNKNKEVAAEETMGVDAVDNVYETTKPYRQAVLFYDSMIKDGVATQVSRTTTKTSTAWELRLTSGALENVIVRNTRPTTIETIQGIATTERDTVKQDLGKDSPSMQDSDK